MDLSVVVPAFNEEEVIEESFKRLKTVLEGTGLEYELIFINDGSRDKTLAMLSDIAGKDKRVKVIDFSRNFGHQVAISAGMDYSSGDAVVIIDADLQDPPEVIPKMVEKWREGYEVVYGKRLARAGETFFKKFTAKAFYRVLHGMTDVDIPVDTGDFRLIDRKVCNTMSSLKEHNRYVRGLVSWVGFRQASVEYNREARFAGETKYSLKHMLKLAGNGIYSFSAKPLKIATSIGWLCLLAILGIITYGIISHTGFWLELIMISTVLLIGAAVLFSLGFMGEYIARILEETRGRPYYIVRDTVNFK